VQRRGVSRRTWLEERGSNPLCFLVFLFVFCFWCVKPNQTLAVPGGNFKESCKFPPLDYNRDPGPECRPQLGPSPRPLCVLISRQTHACPCPSPSISGGSQKPLQRMIHATHVPSGASQKTRRPSSLPAPSSHTSSTRHSPGRTACLVPWTLDAADVHGGALTSCLQSGPLRSRSC